MTRKTGNRIQGTGGGLGSALSNHRKNPTRKFNKLFNEIHITDHATDDMRSKYQSVTDRNELDDYLADAIMAEKEFDTEHQSVIMLGTHAVQQPIQNLNASQRETQEQHARQQQEKAASIARLMKIPRRPDWTHDMHADELDRLEKDAFLAWRRQLASVEEQLNSAANTFNSIQLTPFEKNIEVWRQCWRVIEKSDIIIQIVDARNPLLFRCEDLEDYCREIDRRYRAKHEAAVKAAADGKSSTTIPLTSSKYIPKQCLLVVNKADYLTPLARRLWSEYFERCKIDYVFWSAAGEEIRLKDEAKRERQREHESQVKRQKLKHLRDLRGSTLETNDDESSSSNDDEDNEKKSSNQDGKSSTVDADDEKSSSSQSQSTSSDRVLRRDELIEHLYKRYESVGGSRTAPLTIGLCGTPNSGKSSTINVLVNCTTKRVLVSSTPGKTKHFQTLLVPDHPNITLADSPGFTAPSAVSSRSEMVLNGILSIDQMIGVANYLDPVELMLSKIGRKQLLLTYSLAFNPNTELTAVDLLCSHARMRGWFKDHGRPDEARSARVILKDFVTGKLIFANTPPDLTPQQRQAFYESYSFERDGQFAMHKRLIGQVDESNDDKSTPAQKQQSPVADDSLSIASSTSLIDQAKSSTSTSTSTSAKPKVNDLILRQQEAEHAAESAAITSTDNATVPHTGQMSKKELLRSRQRQRTLGGKQQKQRKHVVAIEDVQPKYGGKSHDTAIRNGIMQQTNALTLN